MKTVCHKYQNQSFHVTYIYDLVNISIKIPQIQYYILSKNRKPQTIIPKSVSFKIAQILKSSNKKHFIDSSNNLKKLANQKPNRSKFTKPITLLSKHCIK